MNKIAIAVLVAAALAVAVLAVAELTDEPSKYYFRPSGQSQGR